VARRKIEKHKTAEIILESAKKNFLQKGFEGTSINDVADEAKINKSLIYHHFENKENLWKVVKEKIIEKSTPDSVDKIQFKQATLREFLEAFVSFRFQMYAKNPELVRLLGWQRLESQRESLAGITLNRLKIDQEIVSFQQTGKIRNDLKPEVVTYLIMSMSSNGFMDKAPFLESKKGQDQYLKIIIESLMKILSP
jgi:AcrR family transcriptional regulator